MHATHIFSCVFRTTADPRIYESVRTARVQRRRRHRGRRRGVRFQTRCQRNSHPQSDRKLAKLDWDWIIALIRRLVGHCRYTGVCRGPDGTPRPPFRVLRPWRTSIEGPRSLRRRTEYRRAAYKCNCFYHVLY